MRYSLLFCLTLLAAGCEQCHRSDDAGEASSTGSTGGSTTKTPTTTDAADDAAWDAAYVALEATLADTTPTRRSDDEHTEIFGGHSNIVAASKSVGDVYVHQVTGDWVEEWVVSQGDYIGAKAPSQVEISWSGTSPDRLTPATADATCADRATCTQRYARTTARYYAFPSDLSKVPAGQPAGTTSTQTYAIYTVALDVTGGPVQTGRLYRELRSDGWREFWVLFKTYKLVGPLDKTRLTLVTSTADDPLGLGPASTLKGFLQSVATRTDLGWYVPAPLPWAALPASADLPKP